MRSGALLLVVLATVVGNAAEPTASRAEVAEILAPVLANPPVSGLLIFEVAPDSQASKAGFRPGDVLYIYDGQPVESLNGLSSIARTAFNEQRKLLVMVKRGDQDVEAEFDPAPLGVRLIPVKKGESRLLWRPETPVEMTAETLERALPSGDQWELLRHGETVIGWAHTYVTKYENRFVLRTQSNVQSQQVSQRRDVIVTFHAKPHFPVESIRLESNGKLALDLYRRDNQLVGERAGIPVGGNIPSDAVSTYLTGFLASAMPRAEGACVHCSFLADSSLAAAPYADIFCAGEVELKLGSKTKTTWLYEQTVFGEKLAQYWISNKGTVEQVAYGNGITSRPARLAEVKKHFPDAGEGFLPIDRLPRLSPPTQVQAN